MYKKITDKLALAINLAVSTLLVYSLSYRGEGRHWNYFVLLADAFLHGRLNILNPPPWLNELVKVNNLYYPVSPPMPAILLMPFVALFGPSFPQPFLSILLGAVNTGLAFLVITNIFKKKNLAVWISILYAFGTIQWYHAEVGSAWYLAHIVAVFFIWLIILEVITKQRFFLIGLLIGASFLSRIPTILCVIFVLIFLSSKIIRFEKKKIKIFLKPPVLLITGILPALIVNFLYNYYRYGVSYDIGYIMLPIFNEPWYKYGFVSLKYIPIHLKEIFTAMPYFSSQPPFVIPNLFAMAVWLITPAYFMILFASFKKRIIIACLVATILISIPDLMHGGNGFTQFGYRHTLDFLPFLLILIASGFHNQFKWWGKLLIILSIAVNLWGVVMISFLNKWVI